MTDRLIQLLLIGLAGAAGTLSRFGLTSLTNWALESLHASPWRAAAGTLAVNILGSFLFGLVFALTEPRLSSPQTLQLRIILLTGFMGAFTTFSTFTFDAVRLGRDGDWLNAAAYVLLSVGIGVAALGLGLAAGARLASHPAA
jgi:CrcB protein